MCLPDEIEETIPLGNTDRVDYEAVNIGGKPDQEFGITSSDTFSYLYLKAAYLC